MLSAPYGAVLPDGVRVSTAQKLQRALVAKGWSNAELDSSSPGQISLRIPNVTGPQADKAVSDLRSLQTVPQIQLVPLYNVFYRTAEGIVGSIFAPFEYTGGRTFREVVTGRAVPESDLLSPVGFGPFSRVQATGADILPGSITVPGGSTRGGRTVTFHIQQGHALDWAVAGRSLQALVVDGALALVLGPVVPGEPEAPKMTGTMSVRSSADDSAVVTLSLPTGMKSPTVKELSAALSRGAVPPPPVSVRVLFAGPRDPGTARGDQPPWRRRRGRSLRMEITLTDKSGGKPVTAKQCAATLKTLQERARDSRQDYRFETTGPRTIVGWAPFFRGPRGRMGMSFVPNLLQRGEWKILMLRPHGQTNGNWAPAFEQGWVVWKRPGAGAGLRTCRVDDLEKYLSADSQNVILTSDEAIPGSAVADTGDGLDGSPVSVMTNLKPTASARWSALRDTEPDAEAGLFLDGFMVSRFSLRDRPLSGNTLSLLKGRLSPQFGSGPTAPGAISEADAKSLAGLLSMPPIPVEFAKVTYQTVDDPMNHRPPAGGR